MTERQALRGRIVQMNERFDIIPDGVLWIQDEKIVAVTAYGAPIPPGFESTRVETVGGTIFPGMIELHNHLSYDILQLWMVPKRYDNRDQWGDHKDYRKLISGPPRILGSTEGYPEAITRFVECKCLLSGVTTSQGITLQSIRLERYYRGVVRNVEDAKPLPSARAKISDVEASDAEKFLARLKKETCFILHLSEGIDDRARAHFENLQFKPGEWALAPSLAGIHCAALKAKHFEVMAKHHASMVWSPLSNLLLYGKTAEMEAAKVSGIKIALGSDWSPSGSKNLLAELKIARSAGKEIFKDKEIFAMVTSAPAKILGWYDSLGSLEKGKYADLFVLEGAAGDCYEQVLTASETDIRLVMIGGVRRVAVQELSAGMTGIEAFKVGGRTINLNLHDANADEIVKGLKLSTAISRLKQGLADIKKLARDLERPHIMGMAEPKWRLVLDHEEDHGESIRPRFSDASKPDSTLKIADAMALKAPPLSEIVEPMELDAITVADDETYLDRLRNQKNLPDDIRSSL